MTFPEDKESHGGPTTPSGHGWGSGHVQRGQTSPCLSPCLVELLHQLGGQTNTDRTVLATECSKQKEIKQRGCKTPGKGLLDAWAKERC